MAVAVEQAQDLTMNSTDVYDQNHEDKSRPFLNAGTRTGGRKGAVIEDSVATQSSTNNAYIIGGNKITN